MIAERKSASTINKQLQLKIARYLTKLQAYLFSIEHQTQPACTGICSTDSTKHVSSSAALQSTTLKIQVAGGSVKTMMHSEYKAF